MRLFVGIELPDDVKRAAGAAATDLRARLESKAPRVVLRWVDPANLHVTLWFLGEVADARASDVAAALNEPFPVNAFELGFAAAGMFPYSAAPRALWLGIRSGAGELAELYAHTGSRLARLGFLPEKRPYSAHLTIARFKSVRRNDVPVVRRVVADASVAIPGTSVSAVTLFRSHLSPKGSRYESVLRVPLT
jgi:RNA 2',3'-cyclic 3'-phosphodiesterase